ncbi:hypothetical protein PHAMO_170007 [Magnetospirillum molischianum DSM 120]|uniref:Uncharacterized protein n=1 Tax=Magnetospirillum molischianum DSM 120 TaxID=1150626 RepID=H8FNL0_MAGML|nr:hypothetical protein PHAMO_170007 [Magnetospirillum molischianum DSM 120]
MAKPWGDMDLALDPRAFLGGQGGVRRAKWREFKTAETERKNGKLVSVLADV